MPRAVQPERLSLKESIHKLLQESISGGALPQRRGVFGDPLGGVGQPLNLSSPAPHPKGDAPLGAPALNFLSLAASASATPSSNLGRLLAIFPILEVVCVYAALVLCTTTIKCCILFKYVKPVIAYKPGRRNCLWRFFSPFRTQKRAKSLQMVFSRIFLRTSRPLRRYSFPPPR